MPLADWGKRLPALAPFAELVAEGFRGSRDGQWQKEAELARREPVAHAADARHAAARHARRRRLRRRVRRRLRAGAGAARRRVGGSRAAAGARDQEPADADPALRRAPRGQARGQARGRRRGDAAARHADDRLAGRRDEAHGRRLRDLRAPAAAGTDAAGRPGAPSCSTCWRLYDNLRPHVALSLPDAPVIIQGEPTRLRQVFHNLLSNAVDAQADVAEPRFAIALVRERRRGHARRSPTAARVLRRTCSRTRSSRT